MNIHVFNFQELFQNSKGKSSISLVMAPIIILSGCTAFLYGAFEHYSEAMLQGLAVISVGVGMLVTRRFTSDKTIDPEADKPKQE